MTAGAVLLLALTACIGGLLPKHFLRRVDKRVLGANSRNENSRWRRNLEAVILSLSDQQIVTGLAILVAGFCETRKNGSLSVYHWETIVYLAWMSSSVHIASLTLLRDVLNRNPMLRNLRVAGMLLLLALLVVAMWPTRIATDMLFTPVGCLWTPSSRGDTPTFRASPDWILSMIMLLSAYIWKLSQLFASSRNWVRKWTIAKAQAALENFLRFIIQSHWTVWLRWPAYKFSVACYVVFVAFAEFAESFAASIIYLCLAFPYGVSIIIYTRVKVDGAVTDGENRLTFGQIVPLFLLALPVLLLFELSVGIRSTSSWLYGSITNK